jgi:hypothetical protein
MNSSIQAHIPQMFTNTFCESGTHKN